MNVDTPATLRLSKFVWPSTSMSPFISAPVAVMIPETTVPPLILPLKLPVTLPTNVLAVTIPEALILPSTLPVKSPV